MRDVLVNTSAVLQASSQVLIANRAAALWRAVDGDLSPVIGRRGTLALHRRATSLVRRSLAWLPEPTEQDSLEDCLVQLCSVLATRSVDETHSATLALESEFHDLLASLIGASLTTLLLRSAWALRSDSDTCHTGPE